VAYWYLLGVFSYHPWSAVIEVKSQQRLRKDKSGTVVRIDFGSSLIFGLFSDWSYFTLILVLIDFDFR